MNDADRVAVLAMFQLMRDVVNEVAPRTQVIVSDHADLVDEDWFQDAIEHYWRGGTKLVPVDWIDSETDSVQSWAPSPDAASRLADDTVRGDRCRRAQSGRADAAEIRGCR